MMATAVKQSGTYEVAASEIAQGLEFKTTCRAYRVESIIVEFGSGVWYVRAAKLDGIYVGNIVYLRVKATGETA